MVNVIGPKDEQRDDAISTVSRSTTWSKGLSPFFVGPVPCYDGKVAKNMENAWQYAKVYQMHANIHGEPLPAYFDWRDYGWAKERADRYPAGPGMKPLYSLWEGEKLSYVEARKRIYVPLYARAVAKTEAYARLKEIYAEKETIWLWDFDGYDRIKAGMSLKDVLENPARSCGHAFVLAMMLQGVLGEDGVFK